MNNKTKTVGETTTDGIRMTEIPNEHRQFREAHIQGLFAELNNADQASIYSLVWSLSAKDLLLKIAKDKQKEKEK
jgi:hypothetical protein